MATEWCFPALPSPHSEAVDEDVLTERLVALRSLGYSSVFLTWCCDASSGGYVPPVSPVLVSKLTSRSGVTVRSRLNIAANMVTGEAAADATALWQPAAQWYDIVALTLDTDPGVVERVSGLKETPVRILSLDRCGVSVTVPRAKVHPHTAVEVSYRDSHVSGSS